MNDENLQNSCDHQPYKRPFDSPEPLAGSKYGRVYSSMSMAMLVGMWLLVSAGLLMRMNMKTRKKIEKSLFADIFMGLFGTTLLFMGMRIRMLFGHN
jgi:hypothetical protein